MELEKSEDTLERLKKPKEKVLNLRSWQIETPICFTKSELAFECSRLALERIQKIALDLIPGLCLRIIPDPI
jgi:hypothetical protein